MENGCQSGTDNHEKFHMSPSKHFFYLKPLLHVSIAYALAVFLFLKFGDIEQPAKYLKIVITPLGLMILLTVALHVNYIFEDKKKIFFIEGSRIFYAKGEIKLTFMENDIAKIDHHMSSLIAKGKDSLLPWDIYSYYKVFLKDGRSFKITCLTASLEFELDIKHFKVVPELIPFPFDFND